MQAIGVWYRELDSAAGNFILLLLTRLLVGLLARSDEADDRSEFKRRQTSKLERARPMIVAIQLRAQSRGSRECRGEVGGELLECSRHRGSADGRFLWVWPAGEIEADGLSGGGVVARDGGPGLKIGTYERLGGDLSE